MPQDLAQSLAPSSAPDISQAHILVGAGTAPAAPVVRHIGPADLIDALRAGWDDFTAMPTHAVFLCAIYPVVGIGLAGLTLGFAIIPLLFPLAAGFALIGPVAAIGLYELSRRREAGVTTWASDALDVLRSPSIGAIVALGVLLLIIFTVWIATAREIYIENFGYAPPASLGAFIHEVLTTRAGWNLIIWGNGIGFLFAAATLTLGAISFPLLLDRDVGASVALLTSIRVVVANPFTMALWGLIVAALLVLGSLPLFVGLAVTMPVLGHATWHLYRKAVEPDPSPRPAYRPQPKGHRYAADFPAVLLPWFREDR
jgi:uncharacterized membrane protein